MKLDATFKILHQFQNLTPCPNDMSDPHISIWFYLTYCTQITFWLYKIESCLNMKQLAPLVVAYEEEANEKDEIIIDYEKQLHHLNLQ